MGVLADVQNELPEWRNRNFPTSNTPWYPLSGITEEVGELNHAWLKMQQGIRGTTQEHTEHMIDALADTLIYMCDFACRMDIDLEEALAETWNTVRERDWQKYPKDGLTV